MNVLSLFDGMSCGQLALKRLGIRVTAYYASEVDQPAIDVTQHNFPDTIQLGDVMQVKGSNLPKIDLLLGGSPCQGFSQAGAKLNFEDPRSKLFFEFKRIKEECSPRFWVLENVKMRKEHENRISELLETLPIEIDSGLVSAQTRKRLYWTNLPVDTLPVDRSLTLNDVVDLAKPRRILKLKDTVPRRFTKNYLQYDLSGRKGYDSQDQRAYFLHGKSGTMSTLCANNIKILMPEGDIGYLLPEEFETLQTVPVGYSSVASFPQRARMLGNGWTVDVICHLLNSLK